MEADLLYQLFQDYSALRLSRTREYGSFSEKIKPSMVLGMV